MSDFLYCQCGRLTPLKSSKQIEDIKGPSLLRKLDQERPENVREKNIDVIYQKRVRRFHQGFQTPRKRRKNEAAGRVLLLFQGAWNH